MGKEIFTQIIKNIPLVDYGIEGLEVRRPHTKEGTIYFVAAHKDISFPKHSHAEQYTVVLDGEARLTINGQTSVYKKGDIYTIPAGAPHTITLMKGYAEFDYVNDPFDGE